MTAADADPELSGKVGRLAELLMGRRPLEETLTAIASFATEAIPGADGAGLTLLEDRRADTIVASAQFVRAIDEVQYRLMEGPCVLAVDARATQVSGSLSGELRWPRFGPRAGRLGVHSALSLPLVVEERVVGALNVYGHGRDAFDGRSVRIGELFSVPAAVTAANALLLEESRRLVEQLERAVNSRVVIDQAIGVLMSRSGDTADVTLDKLRRLSQSSGTKLVEIARGIVDAAVARARERHTPSRADDGA